MHLLQQNILGELRLAGEFAKGSIPQYAVLSHISIAAAGEVTFQDLIGDTVESEACYDIILFCGGPARRVGLSSFWVNTNNTSLPQATNAIFRWHHNAVQTEGLQ